MNITASMAQVLERDDLGDIHINTLRVADEVAKEHMMDLSGTTLCDKYEPSMLHQYDVNGAIYQLPAVFPSDAFCTIKICLRRMAGKNRKVLMNW